MRALKKRFDIRQQALTLTGAQAARLLVYTTTVSCGRPPAPAVPGPLPADRWSEYVSGSFVVRIPENTTVEKRMLPDFDIFLVQHEGSPLLQLYAGNHPSFGESAPRSARKSQLQLDGLRGEDLRWRGRADSLSREVLVRLRDAPEYTEYLHLWYTNLVPEKARIADSIIHSLRPAGRRQ